MPYYAIPIYVLVQEDNQFEAMEAVVDYLYDIVEIEPTRFVDFKPGDFGDLQALENPADFYFGEHRT